MNALASPASRGRRPWLWAVAVVVLAIILLAGLSTRGFRFRNDVGWLDPGPGLEFGEHGIAYTDPLFSSSQFAPEHGFTIELALEHLEVGEPGFRFIAVLHGGDSASQILIGQWQNHLIVMSGNDYSHRRRTPRISVELADQGDGPFLLTISSDRDGTTLYVDGRRRVHRGALVLEVPGGEEGARLVLGNGLYGEHAWQGRLRGVAVLARSLDAGEVLSRHWAWQLEGSFDAFPAETAHSLFVLDEGEGLESANRGGAGGSLHLPKEQTYVQRIVLRRGLPEGVGGWALYQDLVLNLLGFIPLGLVVVWLLHPRVRSADAVLLAVLTGFLLSLGIEIVQSWIPSRTSSLVDLFLNTAGTLLGALLAPGVGRLARSSHGRRRARAQARTGPGPAPE